MSQYMTSDMLLGQSSNMDAVFLPVTLDPSREQCELHGDWMVSGSRGANHQIAHTHNNDGKKSKHCEVHIGISTVQNEKGESTEGKRYRSFHRKTIRMRNSIFPRAVSIIKTCSNKSSALMHAIITDAPDSRDWCYRATLTSIFVIVVIVALLVFGHHYIRSILTWLEHVDIKVSVSVILCLYVVICFPIAWGLSLLMVACGYLYGCLYGPLVTTVCLAIGLAISLPVMRCLCAAQLRKRFYSSNAEVIINIVSGPHGMKIIALTRLTPIPFGLQNALFSLSSMSGPAYLLSSVGGLVPMTVLNCYMGSTLRTMEDLMTDDTNRLTGFVIFGGQILVTVVLLWFVVRKARVELKKAMNDTDKPNCSDPNGNCPDYDCEVL